MKYLILILTIILIVGGNVAKSQTQSIGIKTLEKLAEMESDEFESWALERGYTYYFIDKSFDIFDILYFKKGQKSTLAILLNKDGSKYGGANFQTSTPAEYLAIKKSCKINGYLFQKSENINGVINHTYTGKKYDVYFNVNNAKEYLGYSIAVSRK
jgi:hypothetical protein